MTKSLKKLSRRQFVQTAGLGAAALYLPTSHVAHAATPKKGGRFRWGIGGASTDDTMDQALTTDFFQQTLEGVVRNELTELNHKSELIPQLAESWEGSDGATKWVFKIRKGVEFHNGRTLKPMDVVASLNHHRGETQSAAKPYFESVTDIKVDGDNVVVTLSAGNADFPFLVSDYHVGICPANDDGTIDWKSGVGTGGYVLKEFEPGVRALGTRNPNYWKEGRAHFDEVEWIAINDVVARTNALTTGKVDAINRCDLKTVNLLKRDSNLTVTNVTGTQHYTAPMLTSVAPFDNNDVRLALKYAVNREELVEKILHGYGKPGNDNPITPANRYYDPLTQRQFDPDKARFHLKKAGLDKLQVKLSTSDAAYAGAVDTAVLYSESAAKCGIDIEVVREPSDGYWSNVWINKPWCMCFWGGRPTEDLMFSVAYARGASWNDSHWDHERFNELLVAARVELDDNRRREQYSEMQRIVHDEGGVPVLLYADYVSAYNNKVTNDGNLAINWDGDGLKAAERWWFK